MDKENHTSVLNWLPSYHVVAVFSAGIDKIVNCRTATIISFFNTH